MHPSTRRTGPAQPPGLSTRIGMVFVVASLEMFGDLDCQIEAAEYPER
jgi:hypothetical protein